MTTIELIRTITRAKWEVCERVLKNHGGVQGITKALEDGNAGFTKQQADRLRAALELEKARKFEGVREATLISDPAAVMDYCMTALRDKTREVFKVLFCDRKNKIVADEDLFVGTVDQAFVYPREIAKHALRVNASSVLLVHNHPSGRAEPSREDQDITHKIQSALGTLSIKVLDHVIIGSETYFSFREHQLLN